jgi:predicted Zn-dependent protease
MSRHLPSSFCKRAMHRIGVWSLCVSLALPWNALQAQGVNNRLPNLGDGAEVPLSVERRLGESIAREIYRDPDYVDDAVLRGYVQSIWQPLLAAARQRGELTAELDEQFAWDVALIRDRTINAFALPGGYLGVHLGLIAAVSSGDELASVLAHELSHVTQRHIARMMAQQGRQGPMVVGAMILGMLAAARAPTANSINAANAVMVGGQAAAIQSQLNFSRDMEREADRVGYGVMTDAGFEAQGFVTMFEKLQQAARLNDNGSYPYLRSHPMTTERIGDAQARQQLMPKRPPVPTTPLHAMMAARAQVLTNPGPDALRSIVSVAENNLTNQTKAKQAGVLYGAVLASLKQRDWPAAKQQMTRLQGLSGLDAAAQRVVRLLAAEVSLSAGDAAQSLTVLEAKTWSKTDRAAQLQLAQTRLAQKKPATTQQVVNDLVLWVSQNPRDATVWLLLSQAYEQQGDTLRSIRAQAESRAVELDYAAAIDRFKAAQNLATRLDREGRLDRAGHIEASVIDARLRALEQLRREETLQR